MRKRTQWGEEASSDKHIPDWLVLSSDSIITKAHPSAGMLGGGLLRGATHPNDKLLVDVVDPIVACTELMAALAVVSLLTCILFDSFHSSSLLAFYLHLICFTFSLVPGRLQCLPG